MSVGALPLSESTTGAESSSSNRRGIIESHGNVIAAT